MGSMGSWNQVPFPSPDDIKNQTPLAKAFAQCNSDQCIQSQTQLVAARDDIVQKCAIVAQKKDIRTIAASVAAAAAAVAAALLTVAITVSPTAIIPYFGWLVTSAAWVAFAIASAVSAIAGADLIAAQVDINKANAAVQAAQTTFVNISNDVMKNCPPQCWGDLTLPTCAGGAS